jgi:hypothetical protein
VNETFVSPWIQARWVELADAPAFATVAAEWLEPVQRVEDVTLLRGERELSTEEMEELRHYARQLWRKPLPLAVGLTLWSSLPLAFILAGNASGRQSPGDRFRMCFLFFFTVLADARLISGIRTARQHHRDIAIGRVVILQEEREKTKGTMEGQEPSETPKVRSEVVEALPETRKIWTVGGQPAPWRMTRPSR